MFQGLQLQLVPPSLKSPSSPVVLPSYSFLLCQRYSVPWPYLRWIPLFPWLLLQCLRATALSPAPPWSVDPLAPPQGPDSPQPSDPSASPWFSSPSGSTRVYHRSGSASNFRICSCASTWVSTFTSPPQLVRFLVPSWLLPPLVLWWAFLLALLWVILWLLPLFYHWLLPPSPPWCFPLPAPPQSCLSLAPRPPLEP